MSACRAISLLLAAAAVAGCVHPRGMNVGVRASGEIAPGVYGRVDVRSRPPPLVYPQPIIIVEQPRRAQPIYLHVPPGHARDWRKHCHKYDACGVPVYFVKSAEYEPDYRRGKGRGRDDDDDDDRRDRRRY